MQVNCIPCPLNQASFISYLKSSREFIKVLIIASNIHFVTEEVIWSSYGDFLDPVKANSIALFWKFEENKHFDMKVLLVRQ